MDTVFYIIIALIGFILGVVGVATGYIYCLHQNRDAWQAIRKIKDDLGIKD